MVKIHLINCPPSDTRMPYMGFAYIASWLSNNAFSVSVYDLNIDLFTHASANEKEFWNLGYFYEWSEKNLHEEFVKKYRDYIHRYLGSLLSENPNYLTFSVISANMKFTKKIIELIRLKNKEVCIICGGPAVRYHFPELKNSGANFFIEGEGEEAIIEFIKKTGANEPLTHFNSGHLKESNLLESFPVDINKVGFPTYEQFDLKKYTSPTMPILASRGCYGRCHFCTDWKKNPYRARDFSIIFKELEYMVKTYNTTFFEFNDLLFNGNGKNVEKLCDKIISSNLKIRWVCTGSLNLNLAKISKKLSLAGCVSITFGVESFSPRMVRLMNKPYSPDAYLPVLKELRKAGINIGINFIVGYPGETEEDFEENIRNFSGLKEYITSVQNFNLAYVYGESDLNLQQEGYNLFFPGEKDGITWKTIDGSNDINIRTRRMKKLFNLLWEYRIPTSVPDVSFLKKKLLSKKKKPLVFILPPFSKKFYLKTELLNALENNKNIDVFDFYYFIKKNSDMKLRVLLKKGSDFWEDSENWKELSTSNYFLLIDLLMKMILKLEFPILSFVLNRYNLVQVSQFIYITRKMSKIPIIIFQEGLDFDDNYDTKTTLRQFRNVYFYTMLPDNFNRIQDIIEEFDKSLRKSSI